MKRVLPLLLTIAVASASAGTVYRDRPVPIVMHAQPVCFIVFNAYHVNAYMIEQVHFGSFTRWDADAGPLGRSVTYTALRITYASGRYLEIPAPLDKLPAMQEALLRDIANVSCKK